MVNPGAEIMQEDLDDLATLANDKLSPATDYEFDPLVQDWLTVLNQIRSDLFDLTERTPANPLYLANERLVSGPWAVGVGGILFGHADNWHRDVSFVYSEIDVPDDDLEITTEVFLNADVNSTTDFPNPVDYQKSSFTTDPTWIVGAAGQLTGTLVCTATNTHYDPTPDLTISATPSTGVTTTLSAWDGTTVTITFTIDLSLVANSTNQILFSITTNRTTHPFTAVEPFGSIRTTYTINVASGTEEVPGLHPGSAIRQIDCERGDDSPVVRFTYHVYQNFGFPIGWLLVFVDARHAPQWRLSDETIKGIWIAKTLPTPAVNVFLQNDLPPYCRNGETPETNSMQRPAPDVATAIINPASPAITTRPARWMVLRDTDTIPRYDLFDPYHQFSTFPADTVLAGGQSNHSLFLPSNLVRHIFQFTSTTPISVYFSLIDIPDPLDPDTYDFSITASRFTVPDDVPPAFAAGYVPEASLFYSLVNPTAADISVVISFEQDLKDSNDNYVEWPIFLPLSGDGSPQFEASSFFIAPIEPFDWSIENGSRLPIPQRGYVIFDVIVRRRPVSNVASIELAPTDGDELPVKVGIMRDGAFVEFQTITIPALSADSGHTAVFWPVLFGCPLAYQCDEAVNVFALVNFQPPIHSKLTLVPPQPDFSNSYANAIFSGSPWFQESAIKFTNLANSGEFNFPIPAALYNDLETVLNLL